MNNNCRLSGLSFNILKTSICNNNTLNPGGVEILEAEDKEKDLVVEKAKLYVIIVGNHDILPGTVRVYEDMFVLQSFWSYRWTMSTVDCEVAG